MAMVDPLACEVPYSRTLHQVMSRLRIVHIAAPTMRTTAMAINPPAIGQVRVSFAGSHPVIALKSQEL